MRICPVCQTRYDEEIIKFCTKDGTPLVEDNPTFTALPSQAFSASDLDEETVIRRNNPHNGENSAASERTSEKVIVPTFEEPKPTVRPLENPAHQQPPPRRKSNTGIVVALTILGTLVVLGGAAGVWWLLSRDENANRNINTNTNIIANNSNLNNSSPANLNANANANGNTNANVNTNVNTKTPTPTRTPTPTPSPTPNANVNTNVNANTNTNANSVNSNVNTNTNRPVNTSPSPTPRVSPSPSVNQNVNVGIINSRATNLPKPAYPSTARQLGVSGQVSVSVLVDENGNVLSARAVAGHPLLRPAAESAARQSRFNPVKIGNQNVRANGTIVYSFINN